MAVVLTKSPVLALVMPMLDPPDRPSNQVAQARVQDQASDAPPKKQIMKKLRPLEEIKKGQNELQELQAKNPPKRLSPQPKPPQPVRKPHS